MRELFKIKPSKVLGNILPGRALPWRRQRSIGPIHPLPVLISKSTCVPLGEQTQSHLTLGCGEQREDSSTPPEPQRPRSPGVREGFLH